MEAQSSFAQRATCTIKEAVTNTGISRSKIYVLIKEKRLDSVTLDRRRLIDVPSLMRLLKPEPERRKRAG